MSADEKQTQDVSTSVSHARPTECNNGTRRGPGNAWEPSSAQHDNSLNLRYINSGIGIMTPELAVEYGCAAVFCAKPIAELAIIFHVENCQIRVFSRFDCALARGQAQSMSAVDGCG